MDRIDTDGRAENLFGPGKHGFQNGDPAADIEATLLDAGWYNRVQETILHPIEAAGLTPDADDPSQLTQAIAALGGSKPYDLHFIAGWKPDGTGADLAVQLIGATILPRAVRISSIVGKVTTAPTGAALILDVRKNGATIFSALPQIAAAATSLAGGTFSGGQADFAAGDVLTIHITQIGSTIKGQGLTVALAGAPL